MHRDPRAWQRTQDAQRRKCHAKEHLSPMRYSCEDQRLAEHRRRTEKRQPSYHARLPLIQALRDKTAPQQPGPPHTRPSRKFWLVASQTLSKRSLTRKRKAAPGRIGKD